MKFADLRREYESEVLGELIFGIVVELAGQICHRYPEAIYNDGLAWDEQSVSDLAQDVALHQLLDGGQIDYIFAEEKSVQSVRRLLTRLIKRALHKRRTVTPVDRLVKRIEKLADTGRIERVPGPVSVYRAVGSIAVWKPLTQQQVYAAVHAAVGVPVLYSRKNVSRETQIFGTPSLERVLEAFFSACPAIADMELRRILEILLTPWVPTILVPFDELFDTVDAPMTETDIAELENNVSSWVDGLSDQECLVFYYRSRELRDDDAAEHLGRSRATVINIRTRVLASASTLLSAMDERLYKEAVLLAQELCAKRLGEQS